MTKVIYYITTTHENPVSQFLDSLTQQQQTKLLRITSYIELYGLKAVLPHVKKLTGTPLWEIRVLGKDNMRIIYAMMVGNSVLLLHGFIKKTQKTPSRELLIAISRLKDWTSKNS